MKTLKKVPDTFLVLVPHRDVRVPLRAWSASLFAAGLPGAWSFPWVTPLALMRRPLSPHELKGLAHALRKHVNLCGGTFIAGPPAPAAISAETSVFGPVLQIDLPDSLFEPVIDAVLNRISPLVIGAALIPIPHSSFLIPHFPPPPEISFRAAALANMSFRPLPQGADAGGTACYSFEWKIGALHWLPREICR